jgi:hypothetical protein
MDNFDDFKKKAKETMETIADKSVELYKIAEEKTKILARTTKLQAEIALERGNVRRLYKEIGKTYYELHKEAPETALEQKCGDVTVSLDRIATKLQEIQDIKKAAEQNDIDVEIIMEEQSDKDPEPASPDPEL